VSGRTEIEQTIANYLKIARTAIVLKHRIMADNELNAILPTIRTRLEAQAQQGLLPSLTVPELLDIADTMEDAADAVDKHNR